MAGAIFELDAIKDLPLWAQVLIASRMARRAALWLPPDAKPAARNVILAGCDAIDRCAQAGQWLAAEKPAIKEAGDQSLSGRAYQAGQAFYFAADATHAAHDSLDFSAAESACVGSAFKAVACAAESPGLTPLQARIFAAADLDQLRFACKEAGVGRYDGLGTQVMSRLAPVHPPDAG